MITYEKLGHICDILGHVAAECPKNRQDIPSQTEEEAAEVLPSIPGNETAPRENLPQQSSRERQPEQELDNFTVVKNDKSRQEGRMRVPTLTKEKGKDNTRMQKDNMTGHNRFAILEKDKGVDTRKQNAEAVACEKNSKVKVVGPSKFDLKPQVVESSDIKTKPTTNLSPPLKISFGQESPSYTEGLIFQTPGLRKSKSKQKQRPKQAGGYPLRMEMGQSEQIALGKRLRIEGLSEGRAGGAFTNDEVASMEEEKSINRLEVEAKPMATQEDKEEGGIQEVKA